MGATPDPLWMSYPGQKRGDAIINFLMNPFHISDIT
jgi:hypothetical protein